MARWKDCDTCYNGIVECDVCDGTGMDLGDEDEILDGVDNGPDVCYACLGDVGLSCNACEGEGGEWCE